MFNKTEHQTAWTSEDKQRLHDLYRIKLIPHTFMDTLICSSATGEPGCMNIDNIGPGVADVAAWLKHPTQNLELVRREEKLKPNGAHYWV